MNRRPRSIIPIKLIIKERTHASRIMKRLDEWRLVTIIGVILCSVATMLFSIAKLFKSWIEEENDDGRS